MSDCKDKVKRMPYFDEDRTIIYTSMLSNAQYCNIAEVEVFLNKYGNIVVSATNHDGATGYYAETLENICKDLPNDVLTYLLNRFQEELDNRKSTISKD